MGQWCFVPMRNRLKAHKRWEKVNLANDVIGLLEIIREALYAGGMGQYSVHTRVEAARKLYMCNQERDSAADYFNRFKQLVESYKSLGGEPGICEESIREALLEDKLDPKTATDEQVKNTKAKASETHLAVQFLLDVIGSGAVPWSRMRLMPITAVIITIQEPSTQRFVNCPSSSPQAKSRRRTTDKAPAWPSSRTANLILAAEAVVAVVGDVVVVQVVAIMAEKTPCWL
eukprot:scaffold8446_cov90-Cylindrotheca_fusiformis.AAC.4